MRSKWLTLGALASLSAVLSCSPAMLDDPETPVRKRDAGALDASFSDAGLPDASVSDAGQADAGLLDAGSRDAGFTVPPFVLDGGYAVLTVRGWLVHVAQPLVESQATLGTAALALLDSDLQTITASVPSNIVARLQQVPFWLEVAQPEFPGGAYHPSAQWLVDHGYPAAWGRSVMLGNATNYLQWTQTQPAMVLHELAHAFHDQQLTFGDADVLRAYQSAVDAGMYANVAYAQGGTRPAYALTNANEYFAELSEAWFWRNDFAPFTRSELQTFDPVGAELMRTKWSLP